MLNMPFSSKSIVVDETPTKLQPGGDFAYRVERIIHYFYTEEQWDAKMQAELDAIAAENARNSQTIIDDAQDRYDLMNLIKTNDAP